MIAAAFQKVIREEEVIREAKSELDGHTSRLKLAIAEAETRLAEAWAEIAAELAQTGEFEVIVPGTVSDYRIGWSTPRESVKADAEACPDEFVKLERKPNLKMIGDHLKALRDAGQVLPNWARFERGEAKLEWRAQKKGAA